MATWIPLSTDMKNPPTTLLLKKGGGPERGPGWDQTTTRQLAIRTCAVCLTDSFLTRATPNLEVA